MEFPPNQQSNYSNLNPYPQSIYQKPPESTPQRSGAIIIGSIVGGITILMIVVIFLLSNNELNTAPDDVNQQAAAVGGSYENEKHNFSIQFPSGYHVQENPEPKRKNIVALISNQSTAEKKDIINISIAVGDKNLDGDGEDYGTYNWTKTLISELSQLSNGTRKDSQFDIHTKLGTVFINSIPVTMYTVQPKRTGEGINPSVSFAFEKNNKTYLVGGVSEQFTNQNFNGSHRVELEKIISTFRVN